jgi:hypothetical protein
MEEANALAYYNTATIKAVKSFIVKTLGSIKLNPIDQKFFFETEIELRTK